MLVEIHNPTRTPLRIDQLDYTLAGVEGARSGGQVTVDQTIAPGRTSVVDIHVPLALEQNAEQLFDLRGRLHGHAGDVAISWKIAANQIQAR